MDWIVAIGIFLFGVFGSTLISYGWHKREHKVLSEAVDGLVGRVDSHEKRLNTQDIEHATILTSLNYITAKVDEISKKVDRKLERT